MGGIVRSAKNIIGGFTGANAADASREAGALQAAAAREGVAEQRRQLNISQAQAEPFRQAGLGALESQQALLGLSGKVAQSQAFDQFNDSPGQDFLRQRGEQALLRSSAAIGGLGGGNVRSALQQQGIGFAQQDLQNQLSRLGGLSGQGQTATTNVARLGAATAGNISNSLQSVAQAQASGILGAEQARSQGVRGIIGAGVGLATGGLSGLFRF